MKIFIPTYWQNTFFFPIRSQYDLLKVFSKTLEILLYLHKTTSFKKESNNFMEIIQNKKSRIFFFSEKKSFSILFPFRIEEDEDNLIIKLGEITVDSLVIAAINEFISIIDSSKNDCDKKIEDFTDFFCIVDELVNKHEKIYSILHALLMQESGYIRYDFDEKHVQGAIHPLHHFDIGFSDSTTYKIGLYNPCDVEYFINFLAPQNNTPCKYIEIEK